MVLRNLQPRFARFLVGIPFQDLKSLFQATFSVENDIACGMWLDDTSSLDSKGKKPMRSSSGRFGDVSTISYYQRPIHQLPYRPPAFRACLPAPQYQLQHAYAQQPRPLYHRALAPQ